MRDLIRIVESNLKPIHEGLFDSAPAEQAVNEVHASMNPKLGLLVVDTLVSKSSNPEYFEWPLEGNDIVVLRNFEASKPGRGYGKAMMNLLCRICDKHGVRIFLDASPYGTGMPFRTLVAFYEEAGFEDYPEMEGFARHPMMREPGTENMLDDGT